VGASVLKKQKYLASLEEEESLGFFSTPKIFIGIDEVGRGCLAGPVFAAAAWVDRKWLMDSGWTGGTRPKNVALPWLLEIGDSKALSPKQREELHDQILACAPFIQVRVASASAKEIDAINILRASHLAMERATADLEKTTTSADIIMVDGHMVPQGLKPRGRPLIKGDARSLLIGVASIVAKVIRDRHMLSLDEKFPGYGLAKHKGYPTPQHWKALSEIGPCAEHRLSFRGVADPIQQQLSLL